MDYTTKNQREKGHFYAYFSIFNLLTACEWCGMPSAIKDSDQTNVGLLGYGTSNVVLLQVSPETSLKNVMLFCPIVLLKSPVFHLLLALSLKLFEIGRITLPKKKKQRERVIFMHIFKF